MNRTRSVSVAAACLLALAAPAGASANSGPSYWESSPSFSMTPLADCPVQVDSETLTFDFSKGLKSVDHYSPAAAVTADYKMVNPTAKPLTVQMAFPLIASLDDLSQMDGVKISAGGKDVPFRIAPGGDITDTRTQPTYYNSSGTITKSTLPSFDAILRSVKAEKPALKKFAGKGKLYSVSYNGHNASVLASFASVGSDLAVLATAANGFSQSGSGLEVEGYVQKTLPPLGMDPSPPFSLLVFGAQADPVVTVSPEDDGASQASKSAASSGSGAPGAPAGQSVQTGEEDAETYVSRLLKSSAVYRKYPTRDLLDRLTWVILKNAEESAAGGNPVFSDSSVYGFYRQERVIVLAYEVTFPANAAVDVSVKYPMGGTMDSRSTAQPSYTYGYLLNPAKNWASFKDLTVYVFPSAENPYVTKSSIPLETDGSGNYSAALKTLPENDLVFSLYPKEATEPKGPAAVKTNIIAALIFIVLLGVVLAAAGIHRPGRINRGPTP